MSNFSTAFDNLDTRLQALSELSGKSIIPNPYSVPDNHVGFLRDGWGLVVGSSIQGLDLLNNTVSDITIGVLLSAEVLKTDSNPDPIKVAVKSLQSDALAVRKSVLSEPITGAAKIDFDGIDAFTTLDEIVYTTVNFTFSIIDELPC
jgi:hypothetical protein